MLGTRTV